MKKKIAVFFICTAAVLAIGATILIVIDKEGAPQNNVCLFDDFYIYRYKSDDCEIYKNSEANPSDPRNKTVCSGWIYKYSYDAENKYIAFRLITASDTEYNKPENSNDVIYTRYYQSKEYAVYYDELRLYDCKTGKYYDFKTDEELKDYCFDNGISLCNWYHVAGNGFFEEEKTNLIGDYYLTTNLFGYSSIMCGENELIFGFITDVKTENGEITFRLRQTKNSYSPEHMSANSTLSALSDEPVGKYHRAFLETDDVYYDKNIIINTKTGDITESLANSQKTEL